MGCHCFDSRLGRQIMIFFRAIVFCIFLIGFCSPLIAQEQWKIMTEELPPFNFTMDGKVHGISADTLLMLMERVGSPIARTEIKIIPWPRAYRKVLNTPKTMIFSAAKTEQREKLFKWVGPITDLTVGLMAHKSRNIKVNSVDDLQGYKIGCIMDGAPEQLLLQASIDEKKLERLADPELNILKLQAGRVDMFAFNATTTRYLMMKLGIDPDEYEVVYTLKSAELYYAFNRDTDDRFIDRLNRELVELKKPVDNGSSIFQDIVDRYLKP